MYLCLSIQPSSLLALSQFCSAHEPKVATNTLTTGSVFPHSLPGGWRACLSQHSQPSPQIDPDWRSVGHIPNPDQSLESGGWIGLIFVIFSTFKLRNSSLPQPHWLSRGNRASSPRKGKSRNTCLEGHQLLPPSWSLLSRPLNHNCPGRILSVSPHGLREHSSPDQKTNNNKNLLNCY